MSSKGPPKPSEVLTAGVARNFVVRSVATIRPTVPPRLHGMMPDSTRVVGQRQGIVNEKVHETSKAGGRLQFTYGIMNQMKGSHSTTGLSANNETMLSRPTKKWESARDHVQFGSYLGGPAHVSCHSGLGEF